MAKKTKKAYFCNNCGNEFASWMGQCSLCGEWNTLTEITVSGNSRSTQSDMEVKPTLLSKITLSDNRRISTGIDELNRVLGGGIVPGSLILIGGEPGIGKSTLLLQTAGNVQNSLYISAEESLGQIKERADRLTLSSPSLSLVSGGDLEALAPEIKKFRPGFIIVDSIQTVFLNSIPSTAGSLAQVRECGIFLQRLAKSTNIPIVIVGHVTKEGNLAGPRLLEHLVDVVLYFEGDRFHEARILRGVKNRYGPTNEVGIFLMQEKGLIELKNPSETFLAERNSNPGSVVTATLEGTRPILVEVQALVVPTHFGYPKRTSSGFDLNRLNLLAAVLSKTTNINLGNSDIYLNVIGGMKLREPAVDLSVIAAIISSFTNQPVKKELCLFGEVGLSGEVRRVSRQSDREKEARSLGYLPLQNIKSINDLINELKGHKITGG